MGGFNNGQRWTKEEDEMLSVAWPTKRDTEIKGVFPNRTKSSLQHRATRLHLVRGKNLSDYERKDHKCWTSKENAILEKVWKDSLTTEILAALPGRTLEAIQSHASQVLKIKRNPIFKNHSSPVKIQHKIPSSPEKLAYFAGLLDGEGHIHLSNTRHGSTISVANTDTAMLDWILENFGGKVYFSRRCGTRQHERICYTWMCAQKNAMRNLLCVILPFLITKREKAIKLLAICGVNVDTTGLL